MMLRRESDPLVVVGWREWVSLPGLGITALKAKVDTGARTSALHAFGVERVDRKRIRFGVHPHQHDDEASLTAEAELVDERLVRSSSGVAELRPVVRTTVELGGHRFEAEFTLTDRALLGFRMLLGREAIRRRFVVDPGCSYRCGGRRTSFGPPRQQRPA
jgi:hypothetical protein